MKICHECYNKNYNKKINRKKIIVVLGNPSESFLNAKNSLSFQMMERLINYWKKTKSLSKEKRQFNGIFYSLTHFDKEIFFFKPQVCISNSGECVKSFLNYYQISSFDVLVIYDDPHLSFGKVRLQKKGSGDGSGHAGMKSLNKSLNSLCIPRIKIGIGQETGCVSERDKQIKLDLVFQDITSWVTGWIKWSWF